MRKDNRTKTHRIHRLVAEAFIENIKGLPQINHKDENKANNCVNNLEWCDSKYNMNYGTRSNKTIIARGTPVKCIETNIRYPSAREAGRQTNIYASSISRCCNNKYGFKTAGGFHWKYDI